jgi:hypothetical protein
MGRRIGSFGLVAVLNVSLLFAACTQTQTETPPPQSASELQATGPATEAPAAPASATTEAAPAGGVGGAPAAEEPAAKEEAPASKPEKSAAKKVAPVDPPKGATPPKPAEPAPTEPPSDVEPCRAKTFKFSQVASACKSGGVKQAKSLMKSWVNKAKADGKDVKCASCHDNTKTYTLKGNANEDLRAML